MAVDGSEKRPTDDPPRSGQSRSARGQVIRLEPNGRPTLRPMASWSVLAAQLNDKPSLVNRRQRRQASQLRAAEGSETDQQQGTIAHAAERAQIEHVDHGAHVGSNGAVILVGCRAKRTADAWNTRRTCGSRVGEDDGQRPVRLGDAAQTSVQR